MPTWVPWASLAMGTLAFFIWYFGMKVAESRRTPKLMADYLPVLEPPMINVIQKARELAEAVKHAREVSAAVPPEYRRIIDIVIRHAQACEEIAHVEMEAVGTPPIRSTYAGIPTDGGAAMVPATIPPPPDEGVFDDDELRSESPVFPSGRDWVGGQLIRRGAP